MKHKISHPAILLLLLLLGSCRAKKEEAKMQPVKVVVKEVNDRYNFYLNDKKFELKGVGINYEDGHDFEALAKAGGNAFRTWTTKNADLELTAAKEYGFMVAMGIDLGKELHGFDYNDTIAVQQQFKNVKHIVKKYKNHPNLLCWVVGNELNLLFHEDGTLKIVNPKVYEAMAAIVDFIHKEDPNHPATLTFAGVAAKDIKTALEHCPDVDIISVQVYGALENVEEQMKKINIQKPYMITEFGPMGFWENPTTEWGREIEEASGPKADGIIRRMQKGILDNTSGKCLGGFAFEWGQKQERTPTWFGMFHKDGSQTETIDRLTKLWTGKFPENRAPRVDSLRLNDKQATDNIYLQPNTTYTAKVYASEPDNDTLVFKWGVSEEVDVRSQGGAKESEPLSVFVDVIKDKNGEFSFKTPKKEGDYRLFSYVYDQKGKAGGANIPFYVKK